MMPEIFSLKGKTVIITGAAGHLGRAMCEGLAEAGASLAICSTDLSKAESLASEIEDRFKTSTRVFQLDLSNPEQMRETVSIIRKDFGQIDALVNNACYSEFNTLEEMTAEQWRKGLDGGATGPFLLMQACVPCLVETKGNIVNISSMYGMVAPKPQNYTDTPFSSAVNYGAAKAALLQVTRYASAYLGSKGIRVNSISPGPFPNPDVQQNEVFINRLSENTSLGRIGQPAEIKGAVVFLVSDAASFVTGHNLVVDGGWTAW